MLELSHIRKSYKVGNNETKALNDISISFRDKEFVAILGTSGSGKTTFLNIIGGLDRCDSGELTIKGKKTKDFLDSDWDAYRNNSIGFIFQSYNLITHLSIVANVEMGMTLSGIPTNKKHKRAVDVLEQVGLKNHLYKKPNQLSGGQMQRVAIARALANDPEILLCDEPTGSLDTKTSMQIMDIIKEVAKDRLVIMVTHNPDIAKEYADRIIRFQDGTISEDSNPFNESHMDKAFILRKTSMKFITALMLSFNNIRTKIGRAFLTSFASSIGIIGIAAILSISTGFKSTIDDFQRDTISEFPIIISQTTSVHNAESIRTLRHEMMDNLLGYGEFPDTDEVYLYDPSVTRITHTNVFTDVFMTYLGSIDPKISNSIGYTRIVAMNMLRKKNDVIIPVTINTAFSSIADMKMPNMGSVSSIRGFGLATYPENLEKGDISFLEKNYDLLAGKYPNSATDLVLVIDSRNRIDFNILQNLGFDTESIGAIKFSDIVGTELKVISNDDYYTKTILGTFMPSLNYAAMFSSDLSITVKIVGIVRQKQDVSIGLLSTGVAYSDELSRLIIDRAVDSEIVKAQIDSSTNVITMLKMDEKAKEVFLSYLGGNKMPFIIMIFPNDFKTKDAVIRYLDDFNENKEEAEQVIYTDLAGTISSMTSGIIDGITIVLIAFASISLVVSLVMIAIITYTSVLERTREIGILRALGARKKDITRVFDAETFILGIFSGVLGVVLAWLLTFPINLIIYKMTTLKDVADLQILHAIFLVTISTLLTVLGGHIPAKMASNKNAVDALRSE
jgi:putative ABC transport system permease protein